MECSSGPNTCDQCGKTTEGIGWFARAFRIKELRKGRPDPGNLCGDCAGHVDGTRIGKEVLGKGEV
jgi:hypothetical protein